MENVVLVIHLLIALFLIVVILLQRSEGGALGMGGGGGGLVSSRGAGTALTKLTWILAVGFISTSLLLVIFATRSSEGTGTVIDSIVPSEEDGNLLPTIPLPDLNTNTDQ